MHSLLLSLPPRFIGAAPGLRVMVSIIIPIGVIKEEALSSIKSLQAAVTGN